jgi:hypothetical protein
MEIAATNAYGVYPYLDFSGAGVCDRYFGIPELTLRNKFGYEHLQPL